MTPMPNHCLKFSSFGQEKALLYQQSAANAPYLDNPLCQSCLYYGSRNCPLYENTHTLSMDAIIHLMN